MNKKKSIIGILLIFFIIVLTFTPVVGYFPIFRSTWIFLLLGIALLSISNIKFYTSRAFICLVFSAVIMLLNVFNEDKYFNLNKVLAEISMLVFVAMMTMYAVNKGRKPLFLKWCIMTFFLIVAVETIATFLLDLLIPGALRALFSDSIKTGERMELLYPYFQLGMSNYILPHAMPMLIPPLVMGFRERSHSMLMRVWSLIFLLLALELIWLSGVMTAFLMAILFLLLSIYTSFSKKPNWRKFTLFGLLFLPFIFYDDLTKDVLQLAQDIFSGNDYFYRKLLLLEENIGGSEATGDMEARQNHYLESLQEFFNNILVGTNNPMGRHSTFLDRLGTLGLVGFVPYILFYYFNIKTIRRYIPQLNRIYYDEAIGAGLLMLLFKDVDNWEVYLTLFTITPLLVIYLSPNKDYNKINPIS